MELTQLFFSSSKMSSWVNTGLKNVASTNDAPKVVVNGKERLRWQVKGEMFAKMKLMIDALRDDDRFRHRMQKELDDLYGIRDVIKVLEEDIKDDPYENNSDMVDNPIMQTEGRLSEVLLGVDVARSIKAKQQLINTTA